MARKHSTASRCLAACLLGILAPTSALASAASTGRVVFTSFALVDLDPNDGSAPQLTWRGDLDGLLEAEADDLGRPVTDYKQPSTFTSDRVNARSPSKGASASSSLTAGSDFYSQVQSTGATGPGGSYTAIAHLTGLFQLSPKTSASFAGSVFATATAGPPPPDYSRGFAYVVITALEQAPVAPVLCNVANDDTCTKPFAFTVRNDSLAPADVGVVLLTSVEGFAAPIPEPSPAALLAIGMCSLLVFRTSRRGLVRCAGRH